MTLSEAITTLRQQQIEIEALENTIKNILLMKSNTKESE
jgi:hypothetical protein